VWGVNYRWDKLFHSFIAGKMGSMKSYSYALILALVIKNETYFAF